MTRLLGFLISLVAWLAGLGPCLAADTVLLVTPTVPVPPGSDADKTTLMESWGYTVLPIAAGDPQASFDAAAAMSRVAYVSEEIVSSDLGTKLRDTCIGVVIDEDNVSDEFGISSTSANYSSTDTDVIDNSHYITQPFSLGVRALATAAQPLHTVAGSVAPGAVVLTRQPATANGSLVIIDIGGTLYDAGIAAGRRVYLPWGGDTFNVNQLNADGELVMRRAIEWAAAADTCPDIVKRAFQLDGTPIATGSVLPTGLPFKFLLYISNTGGTATDVSMQDVLDPAFLYVPGSVKYDDSVPACAAAVCTITEEATIFAASDSGTAGTDALGDDPVSFSGVTLDIGNENAANTQLDIPADRVWATVFTVRMQ